MRAYFEVAVGLLVALAVPAAATANLLANPGFEDAEPGDPTIPTVWVGFGDTTHVRATSVPRTGTAHLLLGGGTDTSGLAGVQDMIQVTEGAHYTLMVWAGVDSIPVTSNLANPIRIRIEWHSDPAGASLIGQDEVNITPWLTTDYRLFRVTGTAPAGVGHARPAISHKHSPALAFFDDASFMGPDTAPILGDMNCDRIVDFDDIAPFVLALGDSADYTSQFGVAPEVKGDTDGNGGFDFDDIHGFVDILSGSAVHTVPEPPTALLAAIVVVPVFWHRIAERLRR